jgi:hypothetical protein
MNESSPTAPERGGRTPLRKLGIAALSVLGVYISAVAAIQVLSSALFPPTPPTDLSCRAGTQALYDSVVHARSGLPVEPLTEREAVARFRASVQAVWKLAPSLRKKCEENGDTVALHALRSVELLRYAEERTVRTSALDLSNWREITPRLLKPLTAAE